MAENEANANPFPGAIEVPENAPTTTVRTPNMPTLYVNNAGLAVSGVDIRLFVGDQLPTPDGSGVTITQKLCIIFTPEIAMVVAKSLLRAMEQFETQFGKVRDVTAGKIQSD